MTLIVCLDVNNGIGFNNRRQSRDREIIEDILKNTDSTLWILQESLELFEDYFDSYSNDNIKLNTNVLENIKVDNNWNEKINDKEYCFIEKNVSRQLIGRFNTIIIYRWDKVYPSDEVFNIDQNIYELNEVYEIKGYSHDVIKKEIYKIKRGATQ